MMNYTNRALGVFLFTLWTAQMARPLVTLLYLKMTYSEDIVFRANVGKMEGKYRIRIDTEIDPVQNAPRRVPVALRDKLKETSDDLHQQDIIEDVTIPTLGLVQWS